MKVKLVYENTEYIVNSNGKETVLELIQKSNAEIIAPCGGMKKCGKCLVKTSAATQPPDDEEKRLLGNKLKDGFRLACFINAEEGMVVEIPEPSARNKILTNSSLDMDSFRPAVGIKKIKAEVPHLDRQVSDISNILHNSNMKVDKNNLPLLKELTDALSDSGNEPTVISYYDIIKGIEHKENGHFFGIAIDIGTTTMAAYLYSLENGDFTGVVSELNDQKQFGADVISRINYAETEENGLDRLNEVLVSQINGLIKKLCNIHSLDKSDIYMVTFAGNTTMMHFLMGLDPANIGRLPFIPVSTEMHDFPANELGIDINKFGHAVCLPSVSAYIGADIIAGLLACRLRNEEDISLLIDIGTNGEMVLGNKERMISCSTAAGPAFEGANIRFGTGGISGAIDTVAINGGNLVYTTIDNEEPVGICGSGIVDAVAQMLQNDVIDETGRFYDDDEVMAVPELAERIFEFEGMKAFRIVDDICITQKDVREIQNAKAAIAAGISTLIKKYHIKPGDVKKIYLAGGFGNYINVNSAISIGLLPDLELKNIIASGNTAGAGASMCLLSHKYIDSADEIKKQVEYVELTTDPGFTNEYIDNMIF
jgi:uncharacterized 2Fe-2S/4Fe-4S cluster protein (DUF4445 family)